MYSGVSNNHTLCVYLFLYKIPSSALLSPCLLTALHIYTNASSREIYPMTIEGTFEASARTFSYLLHVGMESPTAAAIAAATSAITSNTNLSQIQANSPASLLNFTDPLLLNHWYQLQQLHRLQTEQYSIGLPNYLSHGKIILITRITVGANKGLMRGF